MLRSYWKVPLALILVLSAMAEEPGVKAELIGGTLAGVHTKSGARIDFTGRDELRFLSDKAEIVIPYKRVNTLEYGQNVSRRYAEAILISPVMLLSKSRKHFVTIGYEDSDGRQQAVIFRVD